MADGEQEQEPKAAKGQLPAWVPALLIAVAPGFAASMWKLPEWFYTDGQRQRLEQEKVLEVRRETLVKYVLKAVEPDLNPDTRHRLYRLISRVTEHEDATLHDWVAEEQRILRAETDKLEALERQAKTKEEAVAGPAVAVGKSADGQSTGNSGEASFSQVQEAIERQRDKIYEAKPRATVERGIPHVSIVHAPVRGDDARQLQTKLEASGYEVGSAASDFSELPEGASKKGQTQLIYRQGELDACQSVQRSVPGSVCLYSGKVPPGTVQAWLFAGQ